MILKAANDNTPRTLGCLIARSVVSAGLVGLIAGVSWAPSQGRSGCPLPARLGTLPSPGQLRLHRPGLGDATGDEVNGTERLTQI